jgi:sugar/nucleoside kinase (ribokinase family)
VGRGRGGTGAAARGCHRAFYGTPPYAHDVVRPAPSRPVRGLASRPSPPHIVVLGDLTADVVLLPSRPLERATDVPGRVAMRRGGSAANTASWVARLEADAALICAVGRDRLGAALVDALTADGVRVHAARIAGARTARIGIVVTPDGERSFVADRGAAQLLSASALRPAWFRGADVLHLPAYSLLGSPLGEAGFAAIGHARAAGARVSVDLASSAPLLAGGRDAALALLARAAPDVLLATEDEVARLLGRRDPSPLLRLAPAVVVKRGARGATVLERTGRLRFEVATRSVAAADTTGAGDAFDAGFLVGWVAALRGGSSAAVALRAGAAAGNRAAGRHLRAGIAELDLG